MLGDPRMTRDFCPLDGCSLNCLHPPFDSDHNSQMSSVVPCTDVVAHGATTTCFLPEGWPRADSSLDRKHTAAFAGVHGKCSRSEVIQMECS